MVERCSSSSGYTACTIVFECQGKCLGGGEWLVQKQYRKGNKKASSAGRGKTGEERGGGGGGGSEGNLGKGRRRGRGRILSVLKAGSTFSRLSIKTSKITACTCVHVPLQAHIH